MVCDPRFSPCIGEFHSARSAAAEPALYTVPDPGQHQANKGQANAHDLGSPTGGREEGRRASHTRFGSSWRRRLRRGRFPRRRERCRSGRQRGRNGCSRLGPRGRGRSQSRCWSVGGSRHCLPQVVLVRRGPGPGSGCPQDNKHQSQPHKKTGFSPLQEQHASIPPKTVCSYSTHSGGNVKLHCYLLVSVHGETKGESITLGGGRRWLSGYHPGPRWQHYGDFQRQSLDPGLFLHE